MYLYRVCFAVGQSTGCFTVLKYSICKETLYILKIYKTSVLSLTRQWSGKWKIAPVQRLPVQTKSVLTSQWFNRRPHGTITLQFISLSTFLCHKYHVQSHKISLRRSEAKPADNYLPPLSHHRVWLHLLNVRAFLRGNKLHAQQTYLIESVLHHCNSSVNDGPNTTWHLTVFWAVRRKETSPATFSWGEATCTSCFTTGNVHVEHSSWFPVHGHYRCTASADDFHTALHH